MHGKRWVILFSLLVIASMILAACGPQPETIIETVVVTQIVEGTPVEVVVTPTPDPNQPTEGVPETGDGEIIPAEGLEACLPLPEPPQPTTLTDGSVHLARLVQPAPGPEYAVSEEAASTGFGERVYGPRAQEGQIYRVGVFEDITTLNYWAANGPDNTVWNSYMLPPRPAMYSLAQQTFTFIPDIAAVTEPEPLVEEGEFWVTTIPIRDDITWSDGEPLTAEDVAFTANAAIDLGLISGNWSTWYDASFLDHVEAVDDSNVKYYYHTQPGLARHEYGTLQAPILAEHYWAAVVEEARAPIDALGEDPSEEDLAAAQAEAQDILFAHQPDGEPTAGSFLLSRWEQGSFVDNSANPDYYDDGKSIEIYDNGAYVDNSGVTIGEPDGEPTTIEVGPHVEAVVYTLYGSQDAAILALRNGEVDFVLNSLGLQRGLADQIRNDTNLEVIENPTNGFRYLAFNHRRQPMNHCSFRQAVAVLIDKEFVTQNILQGVAYPLYTFVPEGNEAWFYGDVPKLGEGLTREQRVNYAIQILEQAGFSWEGDQLPQWDADDNSVIPGGRLLMPDGTPVPNLRLLAPSPGYDPLRSTFAIWIETWLNEFGIPTTAELAGFNVLIPRIYTEQDFDMFILGWSLGIFPDFLYDFFAEEQAVPDGNNAGGYVSEEFEQLATGILTCQTFEECKPLTEQVQDLLATEVPYVVLFDTGIIEAYRSASVEYPYTEGLSGLQYFHQGGGTLQSEVRIR